MSKHPEVKKKRVRLALDEAADLARGILRARNRAQDESVIEGHDQRAPFGLQDAAKANVFSVVAHFERVKRYTSGKM